MHIQYIRIHQNIRFDEINHTSWHVWSLPELGMRSWAIQSPLNYMLSMLHCKESGMSLDCQRCGSMFLCLTMYRYITAQNGGKQWASTQLSRTRLKCLCCSFHDLSVNNEGLATKTWLPPEGLMYIYESNKPKVVVFCCTCGRGAWYNVVNILAPNREFSLSHKYL